MNRRTRLIVLCTAILTELTISFGPTLATVCRVWGSVGDWDFPLPDRQKFQIIEKLTRIEPEMTLRQVQKIMQGYSSKYVNRENYMVVIAFDDPENTKNTYEVYFKQNRVEQVIIFTD
jgi:hypothetical protein